MMTRQMPTETSNASQNIRFPTQRSESCLRALTHVIRTFLLIVFTAL